MHACVACKSGVVRVGSARDRETWWKDDTWTNDQQEWRKGKGSQSNHSVPHSSRKRGVLTCALIRESYCGVVVHRCARTAESGKPEALRRPVFQVQRLGALCLKVPQRSCGVVTSWP